MDFESKICAAAYIDKNLKLRWLYEFDTISTSCDQNSSSSTATTNTNENNERLVRKRYHSMPFLLRNMIANENSNISSSRRDNFDIKLFANSRLPVGVVKSPPQKKKSKKKKKRKPVVEAVEESPHAKDKKKKKKLKHNNEDTEMGESRLSPSQYKLLPSDTVSSLLNDIEDSKQSSTKSKKNKPVYFHYIFMQQQQQSKSNNNNYTTVLQTIDSRMCPLCDNFDCKNDKGLLNHCRIYHGATFEAAKTEEGEFHVVVRGIDTVNILSKHDNYIFFQPRLLGMQCKSSNNKMSVPFLQRLHCNTATLDANIHKQKLASLQSKRAPKSVISAYLPTDTIPLRQYYHPHTNLPMTNEEWKQTSDKDTDESWVYEMMDEMLEEFEDVTPKEKGFMKIWNRYIKCNHVIADKDMAMKCHDFVLKNRNVLIEEGMRLNLLLHLFNLWDSGVISSSRILSCMALYDDKSGNNEES